MTKPQRFELADESSIYIENERKIKMSIKKIWIS